MGFPRTPFLTVIEPPSPPPGGQGALNPGQGQPPGGGGVGDAWGTDCHTSDVGHWFAMTHGKECDTKPGGSSGRPTPTDA